MNALGTLKRIMNPEEVSSPLSPVVAVAAAPSRERGRYDGYAYVHAATADEARRTLDQAVRGVTARLGTVEVYTFKPGDITARDPLQAQARVDFDHATMEDVDLLRGRAAYAYVARGRATERQLSDGLADRCLLQCPSMEQWQAAAGKGRGDMPAWLIERWFMGAKAPEAVEREAYALMAAENGRRRRIA
jgi:hypothetical protein